MPKSANNIDLMVKVKPNPLSGKSGQHTIWFNNNNPWVAEVKPVDIEVLNPGTAELDLVVNGSVTWERRQVQVGNITSWQSSKPVSTDLQPRSNATSSGESVQVSCCVGRAAVTPSQPPPAVYPVGDITVVRL
jgi:hypothetical protein